MSAAIKKVSEELKKKLVDALAQAAVKQAIDAIKAATDTGEFEIIISSEHQDRQGEIVRQDGIDITEYMRNPVVLNSHDYWGIDNILGLTENIRRDTIDGVRVTIAKGKWAPTENGQLARKLWEGGFLNAGSIGFIVKATDPNNPAIITACEMLEWSACAVPANSRAIRINSLPGITEEVLKAKGFDVAADPAPEATPTPAPEPAAPAPVAEEQKASTKDAQMIGSILAEMQSVVADALVRASKLIMDIVNSEYGKSAEGKAAIQAIVKNNAAMTAINTAFRGLEKTLGVPGGEETPEPPAAPQQRSEVKGELSFEDYLAAKNLLKTISTTVGKALETFNKKDIKRLKNR